MSQREGEGGGFLAGGCHCGAVRFRVRAGRDIDVLDCNCSICARTGYLHLIVPQADFELLSGSAELTEYRFNTGSARHLFCRVCGIKSFYVPRSHPQGISVNARCLDPGSVGRMTVRPFNGRDWEQARAELQD
jgi:hypothetical protein